MAEYENRMKEIENLVSRNEALKQQEETESKELRQGQIIGNILGGGMSNVKGPDISQGIQQAWTGPSAMDVSGIRDKRKEVLARYKALKDENMNLDKIGLEKRRLDLLEKQQDEQADLAKKRYILEQNKMLQNEKKDKYASLTPGEKEVDKNFAKEYTDFIIKGGSADVVKGIQQLKQASTALGSGRNITGPLIGKTPNFVLSGLGMQEPIEIQEKVAEVTQRNLRQVLGGQFAEREGAQLIARAFNPSLGEEVNKMRVDRLIKAIEKAYQRKLEASKYYEENGTLKGYQGAKATAEDFIRDAEGDEVAQYYAKYGYLPEQGEEKQSINLMNEARAEGNKVRVRYNGRVLEIPSNRVQEAVKDGAEVIQ